MKYWTRQPYLGFGVDAHSMLVGAGAGMRFSTPDSLEEYVACGRRRTTVISAREALEEVFFLGLRLARGVDLTEVAAQFGQEAVSGFLPVIDEFVESGLLERRGEVIRLSPRGRLISNEVFQRFISIDEKRVRASDVVEIPI